MNKNKRKSIISAVSIFLCFAMLVGTTFAWFTDSITSANNKIQAGNLDIALYVKDDINDDWGEAINESSDPIYNYDKWEPGYADVKIYKVVNEGTLALKWKAALTSKNSLTALANVIDVYAKEGVTEYPASRDEIATWDNLGTVAEFAAGIETTVANTLLAGEEDTIAIALVMREEAGNEYQDMDLCGIFDIQILATQYTHEEDSFDDQYDNDAYYKDGKIYTEEDLETGGYLTLGNDIVCDNAEGNVITEDTTINLNGYTITSDRPYTEEEHTIEDVTTLVIRGANVVLEGEGVIENTGYESAYALAIYDNATVTIKSGSYIAFYDAVYITKGTLIVEGGFFDATEDENPNPDCVEQGCYDPNPINLYNRTYVNGTGQLIVKGGTFVNCDPSNMHEGWAHNQNFVAEGYKVIQEPQDNGDIWFTVVPE